jgi:hypothetical protein
MNEIGSAVTEQAEHQPTDDRKQKEILIGVRCLRRTFHSFCDIGSLKIKVPCVDQAVPTGDEKA